MGEPLNDPRSQVMIGKVISERDGKLHMAESVGSKFPRQKMRFEPKTLKLDVTAIFKIAGNDESERVEEEIEAALDVLRRFGEVKTKYDVL